VLSPETRLNIVLAEIETCEKQREIASDEVQTDVEHLKAVLEEVRLRIAETRKDAYDFSRDCVVHADKAEGKVNAEKLKRHVEGKIKNKKNHVKKLWQKNKQQQHSVAKLERQLRQKQENDGNTLDSVDLEQLKIQNTQYNQKINEKNAELLMAKTNSGKTVQKLNTAKEDLATELKSQTELEHTLKERCHTLNNIKKELKVVRKEIKQKENGNKRGATASSLPPLLDYMQQTRKEADLLENLEKWNRKCEIAKIDAHNSKKKLMQLEG